MAWPVSGMEWTSAFRSTIAVINGGLPLSALRRAGLRVLLQRHHVPELTRAGWVPELRQRLGLDLADPLPGEGELPPDLLQRARLAGEEAEAQRQDLLLPVGQRVEHPPEVLLADAPGCVGRELEAPAVVELLDRPHETEVALLDEVEQGQARRRVLLGDGHDEAQVRLDEPPLGGPAGVDLLLVVLTLLRRQLALGLGHVRLGRIARLDGLGKLDLVDVGQERVLADLPEVLPHKVLMRCLLLLEIVAGARLVVGVAFSSSHVGDPCRSRTERPEPLVRSPVRVPWRGEAESPSVAAT